MKLDWNGLRKEELGLLAGSVGRTLNLGVVSSSPTMGVERILKNKI